MYYDVVKPVGVLFVPAAVMAGPMSPTNLGVNYPELLVDHCQRRYNAHLVRPNYSYRSLTPLIQSTAEYGTGVDQ